MSKRGSRYGRIMPRKRTIETKFVRLAERTPIRPEARVNEFIRKKLHVQPARGW